MGIYTSHEKKHCFLWVGDKHSGKTTAVAELAECVRQQGYNVGGILAPSIYKDGWLVGFDIIDINNNIRIPLAVRDEKRADIGPFRYSHSGVELGRSALSIDENQASQMVIVDEYGPWELEGKGWREEVDCLLKESNLLTLLVVRRELAQKVREMYADYIDVFLEALEPDSIEIMLSRLSV
jgi:nucleoside-triphosphatase